MSDSLRDQMVKSGLASDQEAKKTKTDKHRQNQQSKKKKKANRGPANSEAAEFAAQVDAAKRARDQDLNREREAERQRKADQKAARELLVKSEIKRDDNAEQVFNFTVDGRIKKLNVTREQRAQLAAGQLAIGRTKGRFRLLEREPAERIAARADFLIVYLNDGNSTDEEADYPVPDDLVW